MISARRRYAGCRPLSRSAAGPGAVRPRRPRALAATLEDRVAQAYLGLVALPSDGCGLGARYGGRAAAEAWRGSPRRSPACRAPACDASAVRRGLPGRDLSRPVG